MDDELLTLLLSLSRGILSWMIEVDPRISGRAAPGFRSRLNKSAGLGGRDEGGNAGVAERRYEGGEEDTDAGEAAPRVSEARNISSANDRMSSREVFERDTELDDA
jgi:hypothetical protein